MKFIFVGLFVALAGQAQAEWVQVADRSTFVAEVVGNSYVDGGGNWFQFNADRSLVGGANDQALTGNWWYRRGMVCFDRALGGAELPSDCIEVYVDGNQLVTIRDRGRGRQTQYTRR